MQAKNDIADAREWLVAVSGCLQLDLARQGLSMSAGDNDVVEAEILEPHWVDNTHQPLMSNMRCVQKDDTATV